MNMDFHATDKQGTSHEFVELAGDYLTLCGLPCAAWPLLGILPQTLPQCDRCQEKVLASAKALAPDPIAVPA